MGRRHKRLTNFTVKKVGKWNEAIRFCSSMGYEVHKKTLTAQWEISKRLRRIVIGHLLAQDLPGWDDLSPRTLRNKKENKEYKLIDTELYLNNIKVWKQSGTAYVGIKKGLLYKRKGNTIEVERVAIWNEFGNRRVPARPLWNPSIEELGGPDGIRDYIASAIFRRLKWLSRGTPVRVTKSQLLDMIR